MSHLFTNPQIYFHTVNFPTHMTQVICGRTRFDQYTDCHQFCCSQNSIYLVLYKNMQSISSFKFIKTVNNSRPRNLWKDVGKQRTREKNRRLQYNNQSSNQTNLACSSSTQTSPLTSSNITRLYRLIKQPHGKTSMNYLKQTMKYEHV